MTDLLIVDDGAASRELPLRHEMLRLGSDPRCELRIDHSEVEPQALTLDFRGTTLLVQNNNPYDIYLDGMAIQSGSWNPWAPRIPLRMTRSITLTYASDREPADHDGQVASELEPASSDDQSKRQLIQLSVIGVCVLLGIFVLSRPDAPVADNSESFPQMQKAIEGTIEARKAQHLSADVAALSEVQRLLQEAQWTEMRWGERSPAMPIQAYQRILNLENIRTAQSTDSDGIKALYWRVHQYASQRKASLDR